MNILVILCCTERLLKLIAQQRNIIERQLMLTRPMNTKRIGMSGWLTCTLVAQKILRPVKGKTSLM